MIVSPGAASVYGYTGALRANSQGTRGRVREEDAASVCGCTGMLCTNSHGARGWALGAGAAAGG